MEQRVNNYEKTVRKRSETLENARFSNSSCDTDYSGCEIEYLQANGEKKTTSLYRSMLTRPHHRRDAANFYDLLAQIEWQIHGLRHKPFFIVDPPISDVSDSE